MQKEVKIIGLSIAKKFGGLKATELKFDEKNRLSVIKGEVGSGKSTLNKAMRLTTQGSGVLTDKNLYGDIDITTQLVDGETSIFVGCRSNKEGGLDYFLYSIDSDGKKNKNVVIDGKRATPSNYLKSLQTALTWRLDELTSESSAVQRNILLELYKKELEKQGVIFDKEHPKYTDGIIHKIEVAKQQRNYLDMKRKEVGGIADDLSKKGIIYEERKQVKDILSFEKAVGKLNAKISLSKTSAEQTKENKLNKIKLEGADVLSKIKDWDNKIKSQNLKAERQSENELKALEFIKKSIEDLNRQKIVIDTFRKNVPDKIEEIKNLEFKQGRCVSKPKKFKDNKELFEILSDYKSIAKKYKKESEKTSEAETKELEKELEIANKELSSAKNFNKDAIAVNAFIDWQESNEAVKEIKKDYYLKLIGIDTGVKGLHICVDENYEGKDDEIYLMYDGSYDKKYFNNPNNELRKISAYSGTQKPMICLLIQSYLLSKKSKTLPYLWIDDVPIDKKTKLLLDKMAAELGLWLFVNWTGDFKAKNLKDGEMLLENGEILIYE